MGRSFVFYVLAILAPIFASACNAPQTSAQGGDYVPTGPVLVEGTFGGCARGLSGCTETRLYTDGRWEMVRVRSESQGGLEILASEKVDKALVETWAESIQQVDWSRFLLPEAEQTCVTCVDGIAAFATINVDGNEVRLDSERYDWSRVQPFLNPVPFRADLANSALTREGPVLSFVYSGGCARGGHCTSTQVYRDGRFEITNWMRPSAPDYPIKGHVSKDLIDKITSHVENLDWEAFTASLEPGKSAAPSDGVDIVVTLKADDKHIVLNSAQYRFYPNDDPLFQMIREVQQEVFSAQQTE